MLPHMKKPVYQEEIEHLLKKYEAQGLILIVIKGNKNTDDVEVGTATRLDPASLSRYLKMSAMSQLQIASVIDQGPESLARHAEFKTT